MLNLNLLDLFIFLIGLLQLVYFSESDYANYSLVLVSIFLLYPPSPNKINKTALQFFVLIK